MHLANTSDKKYRSHAILKNAFIHSLLYRLLTRHFHVIYDCRNPDFVFTDYHFSPEINNDYVNILFMHEPFFPDFNAYDYAIGFDIMQFQDRYIRFPLWLRDYLDNPNHINWDTLEIKDFKAPTREEAIQILQNKDLFCAMLVSNSIYSHSARFDFFKQLSTYKKVSSGGRAYNNIGTPVENKNEFYGRCKFAISFENSSIDGYTTEKLINPMETHTIPIYWGSPTVSDEFNSSAFIKVYENTSFDEVIEQIISIDNDDVLWLNMITQQKKINIAYAQNLLQQLDAFLYAICIQTPKDAKRIRMVNPYNQEALNLWQILNKKHIGTPSVETFASKFLTPRKT